MDHLRSKLDQQAVLLQELLASREQPEAEAPASSNMVAGARQTAYLDIQGWAAPAQPRVVGALILLAV